MTAKAKLCTCCISVLLLSGCQDKPAPEKVHAEEIQPRVAASAKPRRSVPEFVGFTLGQSSPPTAICGRGSLLYASDGKSVCRWPSSDSAESALGDDLPDGRYFIELPLHRIPNGVEPTASMVVIGNFVQSITLTTTLGRQSDLLELLKKKYGPPHRFRDTTFTIKSGDRWPSFDGWWTYHNGSIAFNGIISVSGSGRIHASTFEADEWAKRGDGENADSF